MGCTGRCVQSWRNHLRTRWCCCCCCFHRFTCQVEATRSGSCRRGPHTRHNNDDDEDCVFICSLRLESWTDRAHPPVRRASSLRFVSDASTVRPQKDALLYLFSSSRIRWYLTPPSYKKFNPANKSGHICIRFIIRISFFFSLQSTVGGCSYVRIMRKADEKFCVWKESSAYIGIDHARVRIAASVRNGWSLLVGRTIAVSECDADCGAALDYSVRSIAATVLGRDGENIVGSSRAAHGFSRNRSVNHCISTLRPGWFATWKTSCGLTGCWWCSVDRVFLVQVLLLLQPGADLGVFCGVTGQR